MSYDAAQGSQCNWQDWYSFFALRSGVWFIHPLLSDMIHVHFTIHGSAIHLLPRNKQSGDYSASITINSSLFDAVQAQGIPHVEVAGLRLNGLATDWDQRLVEGDRVEVDSFDPNLSSSPLGSEPLPTPPVFLLDVHLGRLAAYMRLAGLDTAYHRRDIGDRALVQQAVDEQRILLTCDRHLLMHRMLQWGHLLITRHSREQMAEVLDFFGLREQAIPFSRCMACNGILRYTDQESIRPQAPPLVRLRLGLEESNYQICPDCNRLFWKGTHTQKMEKLLNTSGISTDS